MPKTNDSPTGLPYYNGDEFANQMLPEGGLLHAVGASSYQVYRSNREHPELAEDYGFTYNHAPMLTYWNKYFYLQFLCNPVGEHLGPGMSMLTRSPDGIAWEKPQVSFPMIKAPAGIYNCADGKTITVPEDRDAFMHQRMAFYQSPGGRLLVTGFYGHSPYYKTVPWQNYGIGRAIREIYADGSMGPLFFIKYLDYSGWTEEKLPFPFYTKSEDAGFVNACEELLADILVTQQWAEEHGDRDPYVRLKVKEAPVVESYNGFMPIHDFESASSFCWYHINGDSVVALWKNSRVGRSDDGGKTWCLAEEPTFATTGSKMWGQKTSDGKYAIAYINSLVGERRFPLVAVTSEDGVGFGDMAALLGEVPPRRYAGHAKDMGPQYIRGIVEGNPVYPKDAMWLCESMNKEDIFVTRVPVPIARHVAEYIDDDFSDCADGYADKWNIYSPLWAPVRPATLPGGVACLRIADKDPCDYAKAMRLFPTSESVEVSLDFMLERHGYDDYYSGWLSEENKQRQHKLEIELADKTGVVACRVLIGGEQAYVCYAARSYPAFNFGREVGWHRLTIRAECARNIYTVLLDGQMYQPADYPRFLNKVNDLERLVIRTKPLRYLPNSETYPNMPDMQNASLPVPERVTVRICY
ncbi:MAG: exo-alpha-sialidase [Oscillospiraceae bacterium]|nr:exo-alpha-sialidase [Oscillospiraceae bacterium]